MKIGCLEVTLGVPFVTSLKEKRMIVRRLVAKIRNQFNVSVHEVGALDVHQQIVLGVTTGSNSEATLHSVLDHVINFIESNYDVSVEEVIKDIF